MQWMATLIVCMAAGIGVGVMLMRRRVKKFSADRWIGPLLYGLLFLLGISLGTKLEAIDSVGELALEALALAAASLLGSAGVTFLVIKLLDRKKRRAAHEDDA